MSRGFQNGTVRTSEDLFLPNSNENTEKNVKMFSELWVGSKSLQQSKQHLLKKTTESCLDLWGLLTCPIPISLSSAQW